MARSGAGQATTHTFASAGTYTVTLTVTNDRGLSASTSQTVTVTTSAAPTASFVVTPSNPRVGTVLNFNADTSTSGDRAHHRPSSAGTGATELRGKSVGSCCQHTYTVAGTYTVVLSVMDDAGQKGTATATVTVLP